jgi:hypothetical protein
VSCGLARPVYPGSGCSSLRCTVHARVEGSIVRCYHHVQGG